ncbi:hypothetical protein PILCRDRAFT_133739 [Piloderma croceum F 1598]|uniref:Uncharacterized protein n=1 Tax=Piloderma croceum (strain F 1598) TaxID=765440 RepID=A0A0C3GIZ1_PILCF|nr:hypothetical protein PILCRDRAFT_133739 [Piloderma croceum F 1598]
MRNATGFNRRASIGGSELTFDLILKILEAMYCRQQTKSALFHIGHYRFVNPSVDDQKFLRCGCAGCLVIIPNAVFDWLSSHQTSTVSRGEFDSSHIFNITFNCGTMNW